MIKYTIEKVNDYYVLYKNVETRQGLCSGGIYRGKRKQCEEALETIRKCKKIERYENGK